MPTLATLAEYLGANLMGDATLEVSRLSTIQSAGPEALTFLANPHYQHYLEGTKAGAVICSAEEAEHCPVAALVIDDPYHAYARASHLFDPRPELPPGIHPSAVVAEGVSVPDSVHVGAQVVIEAGVEIGEGTVIMAGCYLGADSKLGDNTRLWPHVVIHHQVTVGARCVIGANCSIGSDGFGFAFHQGDWTPIAQIGGVTIGNDVHIGASVTIDRGAVEDTRIGDDVIMDNLVHIAHNVHIGHHTALAGKVGVAGSSRVGSYCLVGGASGISGHLTVCDHVHVDGMTRVTHDITEPGAYTSGTPLDTQKDWRRNAVRFRQLNALFKRVRRLEKHIQE